MCGDNSRLIWAVYTRISRRNRISVLSNSLAIEEFMLLGEFFATFEPEAKGAEGGCSCAVEDAGAGTMRRKHVGV